MDQVCENREFTVKEMVEMLSKVPEDTKISIMGATHFGVFYDKANGYALLDEADPS